MRKHRYSFPQQIGELARQAGASREHLSQVLAGKLRCSAELAIRIESATGGAVRRSMLRPDLWPPPEAETEGAHHEF